jgi:hypothetical protein
MRKFNDDHPYVKKIDGLPTEGEQNNGFTDDQQKKLEKTRFIYPTLNYWSLSYLLKIEGLSTEGLPITAVQDMVLVKFAEWLLKLAADRQMFKDENTRTGIPRIVISGSTKEGFTKELKLDLNKEVGKIQGEIQPRDASVVYIMQEGRKILSEMGFDTGNWEKINKKYIWLLSEK